MLFTTLQGLIFHTLFMKHRHCASLNSNVPDKPTNYSNPVSLYSGTAQLIKSAIMWKRYNKIERQWIQFYFLIFPSFLLRSFPAKDIPFWSPTPVKHNLIRVSTVFITPFRTRHAVLTQRCWRFSSPTFHGVLIYSAHWRSPNLLIQALKTDTCIFDDRFVIPTLYPPLKLLAPRKCHPWGLCKKFFPISSNCTWTTTPIQLASQAHLFASFISYHK